MHRSSSPALRSSRSSQQHSPVPMLSGKVKATGPDGAPDPLVMEDMVLLTLSMIGTAATPRETVRETLQNTPRPPGPKRSSGGGRTPRGSTTDRRPHWSVHRDPSPAHTRPDTSQQKQPQEQQKLHSSSTRHNSTRGAKPPPMTMKDEDWDRTVHRLFSSKKHRQARVKALKRQLLEEENEQKLASDKWARSSEAGLPAHTTVTKILTAGIEPIYKRTEQVLRKRSENLSNVANNLQSDHRPKARSASVGKSRTVGDRMEWQRKRDLRVTQLRREKIEAQVRWNQGGPKTNKSDKKSNQRSDGKAHERLHKMHKVIQDKKAEARVAHERDVVSKISATPRGLSPRQIYPDELGLFNRGVAREVKKKEQLAQYRQQYLKENMV
eukprot:TRINITY_DN56061_c0_g2_i2.p1 TRINITY_DN56061_c0_g2~~TRINITY_DN56061_c0_g2_i2.p1  ORF type:complete len:382 (+),score=68.47 TRINITY_DN56061_c0_g2_i2:204-1349(+)